MRRWRLPNGRASAEHAADQAGLLGHVVYKLNDDVYPVLAPALVGVIEGIAGLATSQASGKKVWWPVFLLDTGQVAVQNDPKRNWNPQQHDADIGTDCCEVISPMIRRTDCLDQMNGPKAEDQMDDQRVGQRPQRQFEIAARRPRRARNAQLSDDEAGHQERDCSEDRKRRVEHRRFLAGRQDDASDNCRPEIATDPPSRRNRLTTAYRDCRATQPSAGDQSGSPSRRATVHLLSPLGQVERDALSQGLAQLVQGVAGAKQPGSSGTSAQ
jgi:hypothetical protein